MSFDPEEMVMFKGQMFTKNVLWHKCKGLGWTAKFFGELTDEQIARVLEERLTPEKMGFTMVAKDDPRKIPDLNSEEGSDPGIMGAGGAVAEAVAAFEPPIPPTAPRSEAGVAMTAVVPPSSTGKHLAPIDPTRTRPAGLPMTDQSGTPMPPVKPFVISPKPPKTDTGKLMSMLDAAFQLAQNETTLSTAKTLITANGLERAFQSLYSDLAKKVLGRFDTTPDAKCRGGVVLEIEVEAESGYIHIITTAGLITITGHGLVHKGANS